MAIPEPKKIQFSVPPEIKQRLEERVPWGQLKTLYVAITEDLLYLLEKENPQLVIAAIVSKKLTLKDIIRKTDEETERT